MPKIMLIDAAQPEETRVAVMDGRRLDNFDIESASKKQLKGNIYLAKVTRVEPSLQAAFVSYGGNRHGFLPFAEIHPDYYRIPVEDRERLLAEQEELSRQLMEEAKAREERELAEAEERAATGTPEGADASESEVEPTDEEIDAEVLAQPQPEENESSAEEDSDEDESDDEEDEEDGDDDSDDESENDEAETPQSEEAEGEAQEASAETSEGAEEGQPEAVEGDQQNRGRGRGRGRRRGRGRGNRRGLERRPDKVTDRESVSHDEDDTGITPLWKRMRRSYKIQEVIKRGQIMLIQVVKEERGNKGAAVTTYITMPGRYCVLMPNSPQSGGVSRKVSSHADRRKMRDLLEELQVPAGMSVILRTAGVDRTPEEVGRDLDYLMRLWDRVRDTTMQSTAPALIHEEGSLVKRAVRDLYTKDIKDIVVEGAEGARIAKEMMSIMMPDHADVVREYKDTVPLFIKYGAEPQIDAIHSNTVTLPSGGYLVINPTEALVSIDINSGRATRERHIEETALKTNLEAADEISRQLRLRDLGGLVVIDFIDMESRRHNAMVEKRMRDALSTDRARVQVGRISSFGLMELSRQRLRPSLTDTHFQTCPHCRGLGMMRTTEAMALAAVRAIETVGMEGRAAEVTITLTEDVATFLFNAKRATLSMLEQRYGLAVVVRIAHVVDSDHGFLMEVTRTRRAERIGAIESDVEADLTEEDFEANSVDAEEGDEPQPQSNDSDFDAQFGRGGRGRGDRGDRGAADRNGERGGRRRGRRGGRNRFRDRDGQPQQGGSDDSFGNVIPEEGHSDIDDNIGNRKSADDMQEGDDFQPGNDRGQPQGQDGERRGGRGRGRRRGGRGGGRGEGGRERNREGGNREHPQSEGNNFGDAPREQHQPRREATTIQPQAPVHRAPAEPEQPRVRDYEVVNEIKGEKKKGWWKKLTG